MTPLAGIRLEAGPPTVCSVHSTSMSRQCDSPCASSYRLWIRIVAPSLMSTHSRVQYGEHASEQQRSQRYHPGASGPAAGRRALRYLPLALTRSVCNVGSGALTGPSPLGTTRTVYPPADAPP